MEARLAEVQKQLDETQEQLSRERKRQKRLKSKDKTQSKELLLLNKKVEEIIATIGNSKKEDPFDDVQTSLSVDNELETPLENVSNDENKRPRDDERSIAGSNVSISSGPSVAFVGSTIRAPTWKNSENIESARSFVKEYKKYREEVLLARKNGYNMPLVTVYNCLEDIVKEKLRFELAKELESYNCDGLLNHIEETRVKASLINIDLKVEQPVPIWLDGTLPVPTVSRWLVAVKQQLDKRNAAHLLDSKSSEDQKRVADYLMRGISPNTLLMSVRNELNGDMDNLNIDKVRKATVYALEKGGIYINNKLNKERKENNYLRRDDKDYHKPGHRKFGKTFNKVWKTDNSYKSNKVSNQNKKIVMDIDVNNPPPGINTSIDPTSIKDKGICAVCLNRGHFVKSCPKATQEQKDWYHAYSRKKYFEKDKVNNKV